LGVERTDLWAVDRTTIEGNDMKLRTPLVAALSGIALIVAGCGGSSSSGPTRADWIVKADGICKVSKDGIAKLTDPATPADLAPWLTTVMQLKTQEMADLKALEAPSADKATIDKMLGLAGTATPALQKALDAAKTGDAAAATAAIQDPAVSKSQDEAKKMAADFGLKVCGQ
jgi:hypothetical protein